MKIARYVRNDTPSFGFVIGERLIDRRELGVEAGTVREFIADGSLPEPSRATAARGVPLGDVRLLPPVELDKVVCAGVNFNAHRAEAGRSTERPDHPTIFTRFGDSHVSHLEPMRKPAESQKFDYEGELAVVIGRDAWHVSEEDALSHVYGYTAYNDSSARDWQVHSPQWIPGKNFYRSGSIGPFLVTADETGDLGEAWLETRVNGQTRQRARIGDMVFTVPELIAYITSFTPLRPGDVIAAGTPGGVGRFMTPETYLVAGDVVEVEIDRVGLLSNTVQDAA